MKPKLVFVYDASQAIAKHALPVPNQFLVAGKNATQKLQPQIAASRTGSNSRHLRHVVSRTMLAQFAGAQVNHTIRRIEQPGIGIPLVNSSCYAAVALA